MLRSRIRDIVERGTLALGAQWWGPGRRPDRTLILAYHNVLPDSQAAGRNSLHLALSTFVAHLERILETHDVVGLDRIGVPAHGRPRVVITFDDAYRGAIRYAIPELSRRGLPATVFVAPGFLPDGEFWWDAVRGSGGEELSEMLRAEALDACGGRDSAVREWARTRGLRVEPVESVCRAAGMAELDTALSMHEGLTLGSHTWSHPNLTRIGGVELTRELCKPLEWLRDRFSRVLPWLAYPYGISSPTVGEAARDAGYTGAVLVEGGALRGEAMDMFAVPRLNIPAGLSPAGFQLRLAGVLAR